MTSYIAPTPGAVNGNQSGKEKENVGISKYRNTHFLGSIDRKSRSSEDDEWVVARV